mmetsp:Transcript_1579/g.6317  ORF Transcript_1579/g.6317 Transcript_1579/m.6317 type:complete len:281 (+) Transcript_1579:636-1478(+)
MGLRTGVSPQGRRTRRKRRCARPSGRRWSGTGEPGRRPLGAGPRTAQAATRARPPTAARDRPASMPRRRRGSSREPLRWCPGWRPSMRRRRERTSWQPRRQRGGWRGPCKASSAGAGAGRSPALCLTGRLDARAAPAPVAGREGAISSALRTEASPPAARARRAARRRARQATGTAGADQLPGTARTIHPRGRRAGHHKLGRQGSGRLPGLLRSWPPARQRPLLPLCPKPPALRRAGCRSGERAEGRGRPIATSGPAVDAIRASCAAARDGAEFVCGEGV